jgi:hypothetical protein
MAWTKLSISKDVRINLAYYAHIHPQKYPDSKALTLREMFLGAIPTNISSMSTNVSNFISQ